MATYTYVIIDDAGKQKKGSINGDSREKVMDKLKKNGATIVSLNDAGALNRDIEISFLQPKPKPRDMAVFCRQFVSIVSAGVPVLSALEMLSEQTENKKLAAAVDKCRRSIERGETLAQSMAESPDIFPSMFITMVEAGEASGSLETSFTRMAEQYEKTAKLRATVRKATTYPIVILVIAAIAVGILLTKVVPTFEDMLNDLGIPLPGITKFVIAASSFLQEWWYIVIAVGVLIVLGLRVFKGSETGAHLLGKL
ncbi:MAG: type II secretion system F family protein, partial [Oscillospiraceae bacterium]